MATYLQGVTDQIGPPQLYTPDYQFLTQVMGTQQARYDQGFQAIKSLYNSMLNKPLQNADNQQYRQDVFKKIEGQIRQLAGVDLANQTNIMKAASIFDPIAKDEEILHDMNVTSHIQKEMERARAISQSTDVKVRSTYNPMAVEDLGYVLQDLQQARRGDGSIRSVQKRDFVQFEDVNEYLNQQAKDAGLKIENVKLQNGYIIKTVNGAGASQEFGQWAAQTLGNRFDRQFQVMGRVNAERQIRSNMDLGMSREEATRKVAQPVRDQLVETHADRGTAIKMHLEDIKQRIHQYEKAYGKTGAPKEKALQYELLKKQRDNFQSSLKDVQSEVEHLQQEDGLEYVASNLNGHFTGEARRKVSNVWGDTRAKVTAEIDVRPDQTWISNMDRSLRASIHKDNLKFNYDKLKQDGLQHQDKMKMEQFKTQMDLEKARLKGELPTNELIGPYTAAGQTNTAADVLLHQTRNEQNKIFDNAFGGNGTLIEYTVKDHHRFQPALNKLKAVADGRETHLSATEMKLLQELGQRYGVEVGQIKSNAYAAQTIMQLAQGAYQNATKLMGSDDSGKKGTLGADTRKAMQTVVTNSKIMYEKLANTEKENIKITDKIYDPATGKTRPEYEGVRRIGYDHRNRPVYDVSSLSYEQKMALSQNLNPSLEKESRLSGSSYALKGINDAMIQNVLSPNAVNSFKLNGEDMTASFQRGEEADFVKELKMLPSTELAAVFGNAAIANFDPVSRTVEVSLKVGGDNKTMNKFKSLKGKQGEITVTLPYDKVAGNPALAARLGSMIQDNDVNYSSLGIAQELLENEYAVLQAPSYMSSAGFDYTAHLVKDRASGQNMVSLNVEYLDPEKNRKVSHKESIKLPTLDKKGLLSVETGIYNLYNKYEQGLITYENNGNFESELVQLNIDND